MTEATLSFAPGVVIAETYEIERQLGRGGMGDVWLAKHRRLAGKQVAIKILHVDRALPQEALARFKREAEIAARLEHPNIVQVLDFNTLPTGQPYLVMEFLKGQSLSARAGGRPQPLELIVTVMRQVGAALQAAHRAGVVHRDLKPENIFLVPTAVGDQVKVLDFGISKLSDSNTVQTTDSVLIGTPLYMSPEQAMGNNSDVGPQSDLFSLGSITYELLTGVAPFMADNIAKVVFRIAYEKHAPLQVVRGDLPAYVLAAVEHALMKEKDKRTPNIEAFVEEISGQALANVSEESSGVFKPGIPLTSSMISGETRAGLATPQNASVPAVKSDNPNDGAKTISGKSFVFAIIGIVVVISGIVTKVRMDNWAERAAYRASMVDAGFTMLTDGTFIRDAGGAEVPVPIVPAIVDAGSPERIDAGSPEVVDAGVAVQRPVRVEVPLTPDEATALAAARAKTKDGKWEQLWDARAALRLQFTSPAGHRAFLELMVEVLCARQDNTQLIQHINEYRGVSGANLRALRAACIKRYPSANDLDW